MIWHSPPRAAFNFLCRSLSNSTQPPEIDTLRRQIRGNRLDWPRIVALASEHMVSPAIFPLLAQKGLADDLPAEVRDYFEAIWLLNQTRNAAIQQQAIQLAKLLNSIGVEPVLLKGTAHLLAQLYPNPGIRFIRDIDILVPVTSLADCVGILVQNGYRSDIEGKIPTADIKHFPILKHVDFEVGVELHQHPLDPEYRPMLAATTMLKRSEQLAITGTTTRVPSAAQRLIHHVIHAQLQHQHFRHFQISLRQLLDACSLSRAVTKDAGWNEVRNAFANHGHSVVLESYLVSANRLLSAEHPVEIRPSLRAAVSSRHAILCQEYRSLFILSLVVSGAGRRVRKILDRAVSPAQLCRLPFQRRTYARIANALRSTLHNPG